MRILSRKRLREFATRHPGAKAQLDAWWAEASKAKWKSFHDLNQRYRTADQVAGNLVIFNICGNKYRLIVKIDYNASMGFIKFVGTHAEYDKIDVKNL